MDIDAYTRRRRQDWRRLEKLVRKRRLTGADIDQLVSLYQSTSSDLATLSSNVTDPDVVAEVSQLVSRARGRISGARAPLRVGLGKFFFITLPVALYRIGPLFLLTWVFAAVVALVAGVWAATHPEYLAQMGSEDQLREYAQDTFKAYYTNYPAPDFAAQVWTNNARIAVIMVATFFTGFLPVYLLVANFAQVGTAGALMYTYGDIGVFFGLITPHGILELSCIVLACAVALRLMWAFLVPGQLSRSESLSSEGRIFVPVGVGLILLLGISGIEEGFLTPSQLLPWVKIPIAVLVMALIVAYVVFFARRAQRLGLLADLDPDQAGYFITLR